jgi:glycosyltransferase involved in cell wall biosynthesis
MNLLHDTSFSFTAHASNDLFVRPLLLLEKTARARFVVPVCDYSQHYLDSVTEYRFSHKMHRIYNGVDLREPRKPPDASPPGTFPREDGALTIVSVGSLVSPKGHASLIRVCARLRAGGRNVECRIIGEGPERATLERLIASHRVHGTVHLLGALPLDEVYAELGNADVFVLLAEIGPSGYRDGFPTVVLEAMATGLPVLSTRISGIPEMVLDGVTGRLVAERDLEAATSALQELLESAEKRRAMGAAGRSRVKQLFHVEQSVDQLADLLGSAVSGGEPTPAQPGAGFQHLPAGVS